MTTKAEWDAMDDLQQMMHARKTHEQLIEVLKIGIDEYIGRAGEGFPTFSYLTACAEVAAFGVPKHEPMRSELIKLFIKHFKQCVEDNHD